MDDPGRRSVEVLREEAAQAARDLVAAHERGDISSFSFNLGVLWAVAGLIYDGNIREGRA